MDDRMKGNRRIKTCFDELYMREEEDGDDDKKADAKCQLLSPIKILFISLSFFLISIIGFYTLFIFFFLCFYF